jgi:light-regulated signal transduction histidine kinase (bacteriophytochrome)
MAQAGHKPSEHRAEYDVEDLRSALEAERKLRVELEKRLRGANAEFQEFIFRVAHDLHEPLRAIDSFSELIAREGSDARMDVFRHHILEGIAKIHNLLDGITEYAGAESPSRYLVRTDMNDVFRQAVQRATPRLAHQSPVLTSDALPVVIGDFDKLVKVMAHLLDNAVRYAGRPDPQVHVSSRTAGAEWMFSVKDNGPGIDPACHERIFGVFKRLHGKTYPGVGLGLAFCKRAIEGQGGRIWVESTAGNGSTFCFTLPSSD